MHELSLMADLLSKINQLGRDQSANRIVGVKVRLGALAHISAAHFRQHFVEGIKGTRAEGARLDVVLGHDVADPHAQDILLESIDVE